MLSFNLTESQLRLLCDSLESHISALAYLVQIGHCQESVARQRIHDLEESRQLLSQARNLLKEKSNA